MKTLSKSLLLVLALTLAAFGQTSLRGTWTAEVSSKDSQKIQLNLYRGGHHGQFGQSYSFSELNGLHASAVAGTNTPVKFQIQHDAGPIQFEGEFNKGLGHGEFNFTANPQFVAEMKQMGYSEAGSKAFELAALDVSRPFAKEIRDLGFRTSLDELIQARIFNVNRAQIEGLKSVGITNPSLETLVQYRIFDVNPEYIREMRASFPNVSLDQMVQMRIHKATPEFAKEMAKLGYGNLDADQLVAFRIHGVSPEFIREVGDLASRISTRIS
jgi:hypothetical protein